MRIRENIRYADVTAEQLIAQWDAYEKRADRAYAVVVLILGGLALCALVWWG